MKKREENHSLSFQTNTKCSQQRECGSVSVIHLIKTTGEKHYLKRCGCLFGTLVSLTSLLWLVMFGVLNTKSICDDITAVDKQSDPVVINFCIMKKCQFDLSSCSQECPIGYTLDEKGCPTSCMCGESGYFQGDIAFSSNDIPLLLKMILNQDSITSFDIPEFNSDLTELKVGTWGCGFNATVPITVDPLFSNKTLQAICSALQVISNKTCIHFKFREKETDYVHIQLSTLCSSRIGRRPGKNVISVNNACLSEIGLQHLMLHALGLQHEQAHPKRDEYVSIHWNNIESHFENHFSKFNRHYWFNLSAVYDAKSIMHFSSKAFSSRKRLPTIEGKNHQFMVRGENYDDTFVGLRKDDFHRLNMLYRCHSHSSELNQVVVPYPARRNRTVIHFDTTLCPDGMLIIGDFTRDNISDVVCLLGDGYLRLLLGVSDSNITFVDIIWEGQTPFCKYAFRPKIFARDLNGDGFDDLFCRRQSGEMEVMFNRQRKFQNRLDWSGKIPACETVLEIKDMTMDRKADLICGETPFTGTIKIFANTL